MVGGFSTTLRVRRGAVDASTASCTRRRAAAATCFNGFPFVRLFVVEEADRLISFDGLRPGVFASTIMSSMETLGRAVTGESATEVEPVDLRFLFGFSLVIFDDATATTSCIFRLTPLV